jgi:RNA polymerase sigma factor (sigma-70 family)
LKIVRNACYTWMHANRPLQDATEFDENLFAADSGAPNPEEIVLQSDSGSLLRQALEKLPPTFREVLILRELEGMSYKEITDVTGLPAGTVMSSLSRARERLREALTNLEAKRELRPLPKVEFEGVELMANHPCPANSRR